MRAAGAVAKADYIGKMMNRTRKMGLPKDIWTRSFMLPMLGGFLWLFAIIVLVLWNGLGALTRPTEHEEGPLDEPEEGLNTLRCIGQAFGFARVDTACAGTAYGLAGWGVIASLASFWWNPIMRRRNIDRTVGLGEFYKLQIILLSARAGAWYMLGGEDQNGLDASVVRLVHATMLGMNIGVPILAYNTARIAKNPRISFQDNYEPLNDHDQSSISRGSKPSQAPNVRYQTTSMPAEVAFPFSKVHASHSSKPLPLSEHLYEDDLDETDAMDIDTPPPKHNFRPISNRNTGKTALPEPSPFYGKIPPAPISQEHRLRNPPNRPAFQKTSSETQEKFFQSMKGSSPQLLKDGPNSPIDFHMQAPKLITTLDRQETGLEGWFSSNVFSLADADAVEHEPPATGSSSARTLRISSGQYHQSIPIVLLLLCAITWYQGPTLLSRSPIPYYTAISLGALVAGTRLANIILGPMINGSDILLCIVELCGAAALAHQIHQATPSALDINETLGSFPLLFFGFMIIQECLVLITKYQTSRLPSIQDPQKATPATNPNPPTTREKKTLPLDNITPFQQQSKQQPIKPSTARIQPPTNYFSATQSPGSSGLAGLSLSLGDTNPANRMTSTSTSTAAQRTTRVLRGRVPKPWEVGGL